MHDSVAHTIAEQLRDSARILADMSTDAGLHAALARVTSACVDTLRNGGKLLFAGNGGSAADSQHLAAEIVSRFSFDRPGLPAFALTTDSSVLTGIGNDYGFERIYARQVEAVGVAGDVFFGISTSGRSANVLAALRAARERGLTTVGLTGADGSTMADWCDHCLRVPSTSTPHIQEGHIALGHIVCLLIERELFARQEPDSAGSSSLSCRP